MQHPTVAECCVLGLPEKDYGEAVTAIIVAETEAKKKREAESKPVMTLEELNGWAKDKLAPYKVVKICQDVIETSVEIIHLLAHNFGVFFSYQHVC